MLDWMRVAVSQNIEVVLVRDCMSESTKLKFEEIMQPITKQKGVVVLDVSARSPGLARNFGIDVSGGKWITFWDCDDFPNPASVMSETLSASDETQIIVGQYKINAEQKITNNVLDIAFNPGNWRFVYRRDFIGSKRLFK
jgi:glycosyltransferase involved in cell wall biosynthesis